MASRPPPKRPVPPPPNRSVPLPPPKHLGYADEPHNSNQEQESPIGAEVRRAIPPPVPVRRPSVNGVNATQTVVDQYDKSRLIGRKPPPPPIPAIPKRLPSLNGAIHPSNLVRSVTPPPPPPPRPQGRTPLPARKKTEDILQQEEESPQLVPVLPQRRLPPPLARGSTPPPPPSVNLATKPVVAHTEEADDVCIKCYDFSAVDHHASLFPKHTIASLPALAQDLTAPFVSETEKARAIYTWLSHNIVYDVAAFMSGNIQAATPEATVRSGAAVCDGFAGLFMHLAQLAGIREVFKVTGHGKGFGYKAMERGTLIPPFSSNHAWNRACLDGEWRLIDSCWGAGSLNGTTWDQALNPYWFSADAVEFGKQHYPTDPNDQCVPWELLVSWEDYIAEPERPTIYGDFYGHGFSIQSLSPEWNGVRTGDHVSFSLSKQCHHMSGAEVDNFVCFLMTSDNTRIPMEADGRGTWNARIYVPNGSDVTLYYVKTIDNRDARGVTVDEYKRLIGRKAMGFGGLAKWNHG